LKHYTFILLLFFAPKLFGQTLGGNAVFSFLNLPPSPQLTALGGVNVSQTSADVGLAFNNPALAGKAMHTQLHVGFNSIQPSVSAYHLSLGYHHERTKTDFVYGLTYLNYGSIQQTDASGNQLGNLRPNDWVMQLGAARSYLEKWRYGVAVKFISSNYGLYRSNGVAADVGILYKDTTALLSVSVLAKNMGTQLKKYTGTTADDLPFDLQVGITKRLAQAPLGFSVTAHHLHRFDIRYDDTLFNNENGFSNAGDKKFTLDKLFRHFVAAADIYIGDRLQATIGYNHLRRKELNIGDASNGLNGFSMGIGVFLNKLHIRYALTNYQNRISYHQFGLNMKLNEYFGLGKFGKKAGW